MNIWFDLSNSPHINLFASMIRDLMKDHSVTITCRPLANTIDLLELYGFPYQIVGKHYGASIFKKAMGYPIRIFQLYSFLKNKKIDVAVAQSSFHSPLVARLLGVKSIYMNDNEHALGNIPSFLAANTILIPEFLNPHLAYRQGATKKKLLQYPGVKEGIYLWKLSDLKGSKNQIDHTDKKPIVYIRPEPWTAQYYKGSLNFLDNLLVGMKERVKIILLPRGAAQAVHYRKPEFSGITILDSPLGLADIASNCSLFIGAGGTMTREMAVLGIPTISVYQSELLDVDKYLIKIGQMVHKPDLTAEFALNFLETSTNKPPRQELLSKGEQAYTLIKKLILREISSF